MIKEMPFPNLTMEEIEAADTAGFKVEVTEGLPTWEFHPGLAHQLCIQAMIASIRKLQPAEPCACLPVSDVLVRFPDGSLKRPDISIFCEVPSEIDEAVNVIPGAVIEVISRSSRKRDLELNPPFYLKHGVQDVVVVDPASGEVFWFAQSGSKELTSPHVISLACRYLIDV